MILADDVAQDDRTQPVGKRCIVGAYIASWRFVGSEEINHPLEIGVRDR